VRRRFAGALDQYVEHYHAERNHQGLENKFIAPEPTVGSREQPIVCRHRMGGILEYYHRQAA